MLADGGSNIVLTGDSSILEGVHTIPPVTIGLAAKGECSPCTQQGWLPLLLHDGTIMRTKAFVNASATDTILSPEALLYSHPDLHRWTQQGSKGNDPGWLRFYTLDNRLLLSLRLKKKNHLYYYEYNKPVLASNMIDDSDTTYNLSSFPNEPCDEPQVNMTDKIPAPKRTPRTTTPVTLAQQTQAELWSARTGFGGDWNLQMLPQHVLGTPNQFNPHPFRYIDHRAAAGIRKQAAGCHAEKARGVGQRLFMDFGFMRASTSDYSRPNPKKDRVVDSFDGFSSYLLIIDEASRYAWVFLCTSKEPPIEYASSFLRTYGLQEGGVIRCD